MARVTIYLGDAERQGLVQLAQAELRAPRDQLRVILREALKQHNLLEPTSSNAPTGDENKGPSGFALSVGL